MATNDITGNPLITKPASEAYRNNYDAIFKGKQMDVFKDDKQVVDFACSKRFALTARAVVKVEAI